MRALNSGGQNETKFTPKLQPLVMTFSKTQGPPGALPGPRQAAKQAVIFLIYSLATPGSSVISTACLFVFDGCQMDCGQTILLEQPQPFESTKSNKKSFPEQIEGHTMGTHNKRAATMGAAPGRGTEREKRGRKPERAQGKAASKVARQAGQPSRLC